MRAVAAIPVSQVTDIERTKTFYREGLGFDEVYADDGLAILRRDEIGVHLTSAPDEHWRTRAAAPGLSPVVTGAESFLAGTGSFHLQVDGVDELYERSVPLGVVHPNGPIEDTDWGTREFVLLDPDGNAITVFERR